VRRMWSSCIIRARSSTRSTGEEMADLALEGSVTSKEEEEDEEGTRAKRNIYEASMELSRDLLSSWLYIH